MFKLKFTIRMLLCSLVCFSVLLCLDNAASKARRSFESKLVLAPHSFLNSEGKLQEPHYFVQQIEDNSTLEDRVRLTRTLNVGYLSSTNDRWAGPEIYSGTATFSVTPTSITLTSNTNRIFSLHEHAALMSGEGEKVVRAKQMKKALEEEIDTLKSERERLARSLGAQHPNAESLTMQIQYLENELQKRLAPQGAPQ